MAPQVLLLLTLAATDILIGVQSLGVFWPVLILVAYPLFRAASAYAPEAGKLRLQLILVLVAMLISASTTGASKPTSLAYSALFFAYGFWLIASLSAFKTGYTAKAMKIIIFGYFISALLATFLTALGIVGLESFPLTRTWINANTGEMRPLGFSSEPSYAAFIVGLAWIALLRLGHIHPGARSGFAYWTGLTLMALHLFGSIYGYLLGIVIALTTLSLLRPRTRLQCLVGGLALGFLAVLFLNLGGDDARSLRILSAIATGDLETWLLEDTSSFFRFGPLFSYLTTANFGALATWLGHGASSASLFFVEMFRLHIDANSDTVELGLMPAYIYDYGLLPGALLLAFLYRTTHGPLRPAMVTIMTLLIFNANFSTQIMWFAVTCALLSRHPSQTAPPSL